MPHTFPSFQTLVRHGLYPALAVGTLVYLGFELSGPVASIGRWYGAFLALVIGLMLLVEAAHALRAEWRMTWPSFWRRDLPYLLLGALTLGVLNWATMKVVTSHALTPGLWLAELPVVPGVVLSLLITDFLWYWLHRFSHEGRGALGRFLWRVHAAHHLPGQVYVLMHAVAHPVNALMVRAILTVPPYLLGFSPKVVFAASVITGLQGLVSHFNVDSRAGWLNHLLVGTELHRYHHSAIAGEAKNYGAVVSVWDQLFGSFVYRPGQVPAALGVEEPQRYPADTQVLSVMALPFRAERDPGTGPL